MRISISQKEAESILAVWVEDHVLNESHKDAVSVQISFDNELGIQIDADIKELEKE